jgi:CRP-like cAMP-binding protein
MPEDGDGTAVGTTDELLCRGPWFAGLPRPLRERILAAARTRTFEKGEVIGLEGCTPAGMSAVLSGSVKLVRQVHEGDESLLFIGEPGFWFGEFAVLTGERTLVSAIAKTRARVLMLPKRAFDCIVEDDPLSYRHFATLGLARASIFLMAYTHASSLEPEARLRGQLALLSHLKHDGHDVDAPVELPYSQTELASIVGVSRQTINHLLRGLVAKGLIEQGFGRVRVPAPRALLAGL